METGAVLILILIVAVLIMGAAFGAVIGKKNEGKRWSKAANKELIEFEKNLYEVTKVDLEKPIAYDK